jgi:ATP-binding cassette, subfamily B, bacterial
MVLLAVAMLAIAATSTLSVLPPLFIGSIIDGLTQHNFASVMRELGLFALVTIAYGLTQMVDGYATSVFRETLACNLRMELVKKLDRVTFDALSTRTPGEINTRVTTDVEALCVQFQYMLFPALLSACTLVATLLAMARIDFRLAAVALAFALLTLLPLRLAAPRIGRVHQHLAEANDELHDYLQEGATLGGLALVRNQLAANSRLERFKGIIGRTLSLAIRQTIVSEGTALASSLVNMLGPAAMVAIGAYLVAQGRMTVGSIVTILIYQSRLSAPFNMLSSMQVMFVTIGVAVRRLLDVFDLPEEPTGGAPFRSGTLTLDRVSFLRNERYVLRDASLSIERGEHVAVVGPSGAGKSTLAALLLRFYEPREGRISVAGTDLRDLSLPSLRSQVALVFQDALVFDTTLRENLTLTNPNAEDAEIAEVLEICALTEVVVRLPQGLVTRLGQRGFRLSGGERQRLCLARALLQHPEIMILDEALSGVDVAVERSILGALRQRLRDRMLLIITHRHTSVADFDRVVAIEDGKVVPIYVGAHT